MYIYKYIIYLFSVTLLASCFISCGDSNTSINKTLSETVTETEVATVDIRPNIEAADYKGYELSILYYLSENWPKIETDVTELNGDVLNDAIFERNSYLISKYNITIKAEKGNRSKLSQSVLAGDNAYDIGMLNIGDSMSLALEGSLYDLNKIPYIDFDKPWWRTSFIRDTSLGSKNYFGVSDVNLYAFDTTPVILFNKSIITDNKLDNPYTLVSNGEWTVYIMHEMIQNITKDIDGNGVLDLKDMYGIFGNNYIHDVFIYGTDTYFCKKDNDDIPYLDINVDRLTKIYEKIISMLDKSTAYVADRVAGVDREAAPLNAFVESRSLFWPSPISAVFKLRQYELNFGILPVPKFDENQNDYTSFITTDGTCIAVPITCEDTDRIGRIIEDMAYKSNEIVLKAYYDITLTGKLTRDDESSAMLDIILSHHVCDMANIFRSSGLSLVGDLRALITKDNQNLASLLAANQTKYTEVVNNMAVKIKGLK